MDVEAVLQFLRENGFTEAESALQEDIIEKGQLDFEKFLFPMVPPPPLLKIPASSLRSTADDAERPSSGSSPVEFVSVGSSSSDVCSSEFINPYGVRSASKADSETSSDRLSEFGTARDYPDFVLQNESFWYEEKDEGCFMTPSFGAFDPFGCPSEDKFVMSSESNKEFVNPMALSGNMERFQSETSINYTDKSCLFHVASLGDVNVLQETDSDNFDEPTKSRGYFKGELEDSFAYDCSLPLYQCGSGVGGFYVQGPLEDKSVDPNLTHPHDLQIEIVRKDLEISDSTFKLGVNKNSRNFIAKSGSNDLAEGFKGTSVQESNDVESFSFPTDKGDCEMKYERRAGKDHHEPQAGINEEDASADDNWFCHANEDEYEVFNLRIIHRKNRTGFEENKDLPIVLNTVIAGRYLVTEYLGSAAFSKVVQAHDLLAGVDVCLKIIKNDKDFFDQSLDEIKLLKLVNKHDPTDKHHILRLYDYFYHQEHLFIVCELLRANLYEFQKYNQESGGEAYFTLSRLQIIARQILEALEYLHGLGIIHCDLKPENVVIKSYRRCEIKVIDLGSSCFETDNLSLYVQSRSYRAPEVILGLPYDHKIDMWSLGCILAELYSGEVLFPNDSMVMILSRIIGILGPINLEMLEKGQETPKYFTNEYDLYYINEETNQLEYIIPESSSLEQHLQVDDDVEFIDFLKYLLEINPKRRPSASEALQHPWLLHTY